MQDQDRENFNEETNINDAEADSAINANIDFNRETGGAAPGAEPPIIVSGGGQPES